VDNVDTTVNFLCIWCLYLKVIHFDKQQFLVKN